MSERGTLQAIAEHLAAALEPLDEGFRDNEEFRDLIWQLGFEARSLPAGYTAIADAAAATVDAAAALADEAELEEIVALLVAVGDVYRSLDALQTAPDGVDPGEFLAEIGRNLFEYLLADHLYRALPKLASTLELLGVLRFDYEAASGTRPDRVITRFEWGLIPTVFGDPGAAPARLLGWGGDEFDFERAAELLIELTTAISLPVTLDRVGTDLADAIQGQATDSPQREIDAAITVPLFDVEVGDEHHEVGLRIVELPAEGPALPGAFLMPMVPDGIDSTVDLGNGWSFDLRAGTDLAAQLGIVLRPGEIGVRYPFAPDRPPPPAGFGIGLSYAPGTGSPLFGQPDGTRIELAGGRLFADLDLRAGELDLRLGAEPRGLALVLSAASLDGFLSSVLGDGETRIDTPLAISWSNRTGLDLAAGAGLERSFYPHRDLGALHFDRIDLGLRLSAGGGRPARLEARAVAAFGGKLGPVAFAVDGLGVHLPVSFEDGNAGPFDVGFDVVWPTGLGLSVDAAGVVTGGGFIAREPGVGRYVGVFSLAVQGVAVTATGILDTRDAEGRELPAPGFSLLVALSLETRIQLGYGFTLEGVGGLAAINRRLDVDAFRAGLRSGAVDSVLFPEDPVANALTIVSNLSAIFPVAMGRYVFGPTAILGWGTPTLVRAELGVLVEVPEPLVVALIGQASVELPEKRPIVSLHLDVLGVLDLGKRQFSVDASLHDSHVAAFSVHGDMAMRLSWGESPNFALSVGGLNPHFKAPAGFPALRRVTVALGMDDNPRVSLEGYFAVTSNSLQFGARAELYATAGGFSVRGWIGFDALLIFAPLSFRFDFSLGMGLYRGRRRIAGVTVHGHLTGPSPFHAWGKGCISILFLDVCVPFDAKFGEGRKNELPPSDPWPLLKGALEAAESWSAEIAADVSPAVALRPPEDPATLLLHPMGAATLRQKVLPFNRTLERFGQFSIEGPNRYEIESVSVGGVSATGWAVARDDFAPGDFEDLSETEKLSRPSFEPMDAGVRVGGDSVGASLDALKLAKLEYETKIIDSAWAVRSLGRVMLERAVQLHTVLRGSKWQATASGPAKFSEPVKRPPGVVLEAESYGFAGVDTLAPQGGGGQTKGAALRALEDRGAAEELQVVPEFEYEPAR